MTGPVRRVIAWRVVAVALLLAGVACVVQWNARSAPGPPAEATPGSVSVAPRSPPETHSAAEPAHLARPVTVNIPAIGVRTALDRLGGLPAGLLDGLSFERGEQSQRVVDQGGDQLVTRAVSDQGKQR